MLAEQLTDLDELLLRCRSDQAKQYIAEAVACYRAGAFRSAIVAAWIAMVFDFIHKLGELELTGDKQAQKKLEEFDGVRTSASFKAALEFERHVLDSAKDDFELISEMEYRDLQRLAEDRHRCAHPSMNVRDEVYRPTADLARLHITNAVRHFLQYPPVQGKAALERLIGEVNSAYFPSEATAAVSHFNFGPLKRPRGSLIRNFVIVLTKTLLREQLDELAERRYVAALNAVYAIHREETAETLREKLSELMRGIEDAHLLRAVRFFAQIEGAWEHVEEDVCRRLALYVQTVPAEECVTCLVSALKVKQLRADAISRIKSLNGTELEELIKHSQVPEVVERAVELYAESGSFRQANWRGTKLIVPLKHLFDRKMVEKVVEAAAANSEISNSFEVRGVLKAIGAACMAEVELGELLSKHGFKPEPDIDLDP